MNPTLRRKLYVILQRSYVESRNLALARAFQQLYDLADTFEVLPTILDNWQESHLDYVRGILADYQAKYAATASDYVSILDMSDAEFDAVFAPNFANSGQSV
jgi:hypothetical protein